MFDIQLVDEEYGKNMPLFNMLAGNLDENMVLDTREWTIKRYYKQWIEAIDRLKTHDRSIILTAKGNGRVLHLYKGKVFITEQIFKNNLFENPYIYINDREENRQLNQSEIDEYRKEGVVFEAIPKLFSEWETDIKDLENFKNSLVEFLYD